MAGAGVGIPILGLYRQISPLAGCSADNSVERRSGSGFTTSSYPTMLPGHPAARVTRSRLTWIVLGGDSTVDRVGTVIVVEGALGEVLCVGGWEGSHEEGVVTRTAPAITTPQ